MLLPLRSLLVSFAAVSLLAGCGQDQHEPAPAPAPEATGSLSGIVAVQNEVGQPVGTNSGVQVTLQGGATSLSTTTDATGNFQFKNLPLGTYKAVYQRPDVGTWQEQNVLFSEQSANLTRTVKLGQLATTAVTNFSLSGDASLSNSQPYTVGVAFAPNLYATGFNFQLYLGATADVSHTNYTLSMAGDSNQNPARLWFTYDLLKTKGFKSGDRVFVVAYGAPGEKVTYYADPSNRTNPKEIITNLHPVPSPVLSFVLP